MRPLPPIPDGWRLLGPDEPLSIGDRWFNTNHHVEWNEWRLDNGVDHHAAGNPSTYFGNQYRWITPATKPVAPKPDKEWLNPWD